MLLHLSRCVELFLKALNTRFAGLLILSRILLMGHLLVFISCSFVDLRPIGIKTVPAGAWALLQEAESHVVLAFDTDMDKASVEKTFQVYSPSGMVEGNFTWEHRELHFSPHVPWQPGIRYGLKLSGTLCSLDGRDFLISRDIPFYAISYSDLPFLISFYPRDEESVGVSSPVILELYFSHPMDRRSAEEAVKLDIPGEKIFDWLDDDKTLSLSSDKPLNPWSIYKWSISEKALSRAGAPIAKEFSGRFISDLDREFISVVRALPLLPPEAFNPSNNDLAYNSTLWSTWTPAGLNFEQGLGSGHGIGVEFSKPVDNDTLSRAFSFTPSLPGRVELLSPVSAVFIPSRDPEPEAHYVMRISGSLKDSDGLKMGDDYTATFKSDIPYLFVNSVSLGQNDEVVAPKSESLFSVSVDTGGIIRMILHFSLPFDATDPSVREENAFKISLSPFFPGTIPPVSLRSVIWLFSDRLFLEWEGPEGGSSGQPHYYKLLIPGGSGGVHNGMGSYPKNDFVLYLEALP